MQARPACVTVNVCPAIVSVPVLWLVVGLAETVYETVPLPLPLAPAVMVIHETLLVAVQLHPVGAVTVTVFDSLPDPCERLVGEIE